MHKYENKFRTKINSQNTCHFEDYAQIFLVINAWFSFMKSVVPDGIIVTGKILTLLGGKSVYYLKTKEFKWLITIITLLKKL